MKPYLTVTEHMIKSGQMQKYISNWKNSEQLLVIVFNKVSVTC